MGPYCLDSASHHDADTPTAGWAIVAVSPDPLTPHRYLSRRFPTAEAAVRAFRHGFDVLDPRREPRLTSSKIVSKMLKTPGVSAQ